MFVLACLSPSPSLQLGTCTFAYEFHLSVPSLFFFLSVTLQKWSSFNLVLNRSRNRERGTHLRWCSSQMLAMALLEWGALPILNHSLKWLAVSFFQTHLLYFPFVLFVFAGEMILEKGSTNTINAMIFQHIQTAQLTISKILSLFWH